MNWLTGLTVGNCVAITFLLAQSLLLQGKMEEGFKEVNKRIDSLTLEFSKRIDALTVEMTINNRDHDRRIGKLESK